MPDDIQLREPGQSDLPIFFEYQLDPVANQMAAFTPKDPADREAYMTRWKRIIADEKIIMRTILLDGGVVGSILIYESEPGIQEVTYWIGREYWGKGVASRALSEFLHLVTTRPLHARAARDNVASIRVLEKCGFTITGHERGFANARGEEIDEVVMTLAADTL